MTKGFLILLLTYAVYYLFGFVSVHCFNQNYLILSRLYATKFRSKRDVISNNALKPPKIVVDIPLLVKLNDDSYRLSCKATGNPTPNITWFVGPYQKNSFSEIFDNDRYIVLPDGRLEFTTTLTPPDVYYCRARNVLGSVFSRKAIVQRVHIPKEHLKIVYDSLEVFRNEKAVISCNLDPTVYWEDVHLKYWEIRIRKRSEKIYKTGGRFSVITTTKAPQLHIRNVTGNDFTEMEIRCILGNKVAIDEVLDNDVWVFPKESLQNHHISKIINFDMCQGKDIRVVKGSSIELPWCSTPTTERISWYKSEYQSIENSQRVNLNGSKYQMVDERFGNLLIRNVDITEEGYYFVKSNTKNNLKHYVPFNLRVTVNLGIEILPDTIQARYGELVKLQCDVTGYPLPSINWFHNSDDLGPATIHEISPISRMTILKINVTIKSAGVYQCVAESRDSTDNRLLDNAQSSASVIISAMAPRLISQIPKKAPNALYSTDILQSDTSVLTIQCTFNSIPEAAIVWYLDDEPIPIVDCLTPNFVQNDPFNVTYSLQIDLRKLSSIGDKWKFGGEYRAEASNKHGKAQCNTLIFVTGVFRIRHRTDTLFLHGQKLSLKCYVISESRPEIIWTMRKQGKAIRLPDSHLQAVSADTREFTIQKLDKNFHQGIYTCNSNLKDKEISHNFTISISKPPLILHDLPEQIFVSELSEAAIVLSCIPRQKPDQPWYAWFEFLPYKATSNKLTVVQIIGSRQTNVVGIKAEYQQNPELTFENGFPSLPEGVPRFLKSYPNKGVQIWIAVNEKFHLSNITCVVKNKAGIIKKTMRITIVNIEFENTPPPQKDVILGDSFNLSCSAKQNQLKTITTWNYDKGYQIENFVSVNTSVASRIHQLSNGKLVVRNIKLTDPQRFMCVIKSSIYNDKISKVVKILIKVPAIIRPLPDTIDLELHSKQVVVCTVHGDKDDLNVKWYKKEIDDWKETLNNVKPDQYEEVKKLTHTTLFFDRVENSDEGQYKCVAKNIFNKHNVEQVVQLNVVDVPGPVKITTDNIVALDRSIFLSWTAPLYDGKKPIFNYVVSYSDRHDSWNRTTNITTITLQSLRPHQPYDIVVRAVNKVGVGVMNGTIRVTTRQAVPDGPVLGLSAVPLSSTSFKIQWNSPDPLVINGNIKHYQLCYLEIGANKTNDVNADQLNWPSTNETLTKIMDIHRQYIIGHCKAINGTESLISDLSKFTVYVFRVVVVNEAGPGPAVYIKERTMEDYPERAPTQVTCTSESVKLLLEWNPPARNSINGVLKGYKIAYYRIDQQGEPDHVEDSASETKHMLEKLIPNTNYTIQVIVVNNKGLGPPSDPVYCATLEAAPNAPNEIKAFFVNDSCAIVSWTSPTQPNGILRQYRIQIIEPQMGLPIFIEAKSIRHYFTHVICDLKHHNHYNVSVVAYTNHIGKINYTNIAYIDQGSSRIVSFGANIVANNFSTIVLDCETVPDYAIKNWPYRMSGETSNPNNGSIVIHRLTSETQGIYTCFVDNGKDSIHYNVSIKQFSQGVPGVPKIDFYNVSTNSIYLSWRSTGSQRENDPIISFIVRITDFNNNSTREYEISRTLRAFRVLQLDCGSNYKLEVFARNFAGNSSPATITARTRGTKPVIPDTKLIVMSKNPKSMCFNLGAFLPGQGCHAYRFKVTVKPTNQGRIQPSAGVIEKNISRTNFIENSCYNVTDLHPDTDYYYEIEAFNRNGSVRAEGHVKTRALVAEFTPTISSENTPPNTNLMTYFWIATPIIVFFIIIICISSFLYCMRRSFTKNLNPTSPINNQLSNRPPPLHIMQHTPAAIHRNRKLPTPPDNNNVYDKGISDSVKPVEDEDDGNQQIEPYAVYESVPKQDPTTSQNVPGRNMAPYMGSQAHSYQYPDMMDNQQNLIPTDPTSGLKTMTYENDLKQPLLKQPLKGPSRQYDKGYSIGESRPTSTLRPQTVRVDQNPSLEAARVKGRGLPMLSENETAYRPSSSLCSSTTESSTKEELLQVFRNNTPGNQFASRLQEQDEDGTSTARDNRSTIINRSRHINHTLSDDSNQPESYCESGSSGDDCGIRMFTQDPPGRQVIAPTSIRQFHPRNSVTSGYDIADRGQLIHAPNTFSYTQSRNPLPEEDEEEDSNNYTNNFVVV